MTPLGEFFVRLRGSDLSSQLIRGGGGILVLRVTSGLLVFATSVLLARVLGAEGYGVYAYTLSLVTFAAIPAQLGLPTLVVREVAVFHAGERWGELRGILRRSNLAIVGVSCVLGLFGAAAACFFAEVLARDRLETFAWALVLVPLTVLGALRGAALQGLRRVAESVLPEQLVQPLAFIVLVVALAGASSALSAPEVMAARAVAALAGFFVAAWLLRRSLPTEIHTVPARYEDHRWMASALPLGLLAGSHLVLGQTDVLMIGVFEDAEAVGVYTVATRLASLIVFALGVVNRALAPYAARLHATGDTARLQTLVRSTGRVAFLASFPMALTLIVAGEPILRMLFGKEFEAAAAPLGILAIGQLVNASAGSVAMLLNMSGHERASAVGVGTAAAANVALNAVLIPLFGLEGAAVATSASLILWNLLLWRQVRLRLDINASVFGPIAPMGRMMRDPGTGDG